jgi:hypothetical protein
MKTTTEPATIGASLQKIIADALAARAAHEEQVLAERRKFRQASWERLAVTIEAEVPADLIALLHDDIKIAIGTGVPLDTYVDDVPSGWTLTVEVPGLGLLGMAWRRPRMLDAEWVRIHHRDRAEAIYYTISREDPNSQEWGTLEQCLLRLWDRAHGGAEHDDAEIPF